MKKGIIIYISIIILTALQIKIYLKEDASKEVLSTAYIKERINFKDIYKELNSINNVKVLEMKEIEDYWQGKVLLTGKRGEILNNIEKLNNYKINDYIISGNGEVFEVILDIIR